MADNLVVDSNLNGLITNSTAPLTGTGFSAFNSNGFSLNSRAATQNAYGNSYASWTFRKAPKFFDVVTYTGDGASPKTILHSLGVIPGMIVAKCASSDDDWFVWHRSSDYILKLNIDGGAAFSPGLSINRNADDKKFYVEMLLNKPGKSYVAYLFAHDPSADGIIQCGSFNTDASGNATVNLGWEPQWLLAKSSTNGAFDAGWFLFDVQRGWPAKGGPTTKYLLANSPNAETGGGDWNVNSTGFSFGGRVASTPFIYLAIRRPNKPPTTGTQVYKAIAYTGNGAGSRNITGAGFPPDFSITGKRLGGYDMAVDRLRGLKQLQTQTANAESSSSNGINAFLMDGVTAGLNLNDNTIPDTYINWFFRRAPGFFDVVCYAGTGNVQTVNHSLGVAPELMIIKDRGEHNRSWAVYHSALGFGSVFLNGTFASPTLNASDAWNNVSPTSTVFTVGVNSTVNGSGYNLVAYLFASCPGVSKVGSYAGNGGSQAISCGFSGGARFVLIKRTDAAGDWYVWDTARGIVAANDPHLSLNSTAAEVTTDDSVDPDASGFIVNQNSATNINVSGGQYIFLAIA